MIILIDLDNVTADLMKKWLDTYNSEFGDNLTADQVTTWSIEQHAVKCSPLEFHKIVERISFFADLDVFPHAIEVTARLQDAGHNLYFVTATPYDNPTGAYDKYNWVEKHFPHMGKSKVIHAHHKYMVKGDILLDDGPINLQHFPGIKVAMSAPYNQNVVVNYRVAGWLEFEKVVHKITAMKKSFPGA